MRGLFFVSPHAWKRFAALLFLNLALAAALYATPDEVVFAGYNLENYLLTERRDDAGKITASPKPENSIAAVIRIIREIGPDILGVCEMGSREEFEDFKKRLGGAGLGYTDFEYVEGPDQDRHLALASRYPIVSRQSQPDMPFEINGAREKVRRGFLDVTVELHPGCRLRLVGAHLKSKLAAREGEELLRRTEAHLLRGHLEKIIGADPHMNLLVYGDFNALKNEPAIQEIMGPRKGPDHLFDLWLEDNVGDRWTHYWKFADEYSRIDYLFVNGMTLSRVVREKSRVYRSPDWNEASDHRPVIATFRVAGARP